MDRASLLAALGRERQLRLAGIIEARGRPYPGQRYKHGWIPVAPMGDVIEALDRLPTGPHIYYHGTRTTVDLETLDREIFITDSKRAALGYLEGGAGNVYAVRLDPTARIAQEDDLRSAADDLWGSAEAHFGYEPYDFELADIPEVRGRLAEMGFAGAAFADLGPDNSYEHPTVVAWDPSVLDVEAGVSVPEHDRELATG